MKKNQEKSRKWIVDVLLVVVIIAMGLLIIYRVTQMQDDRRATSEDITPELTEEPTAESVGDNGGEGSDQTDSDPQVQENIPQQALDFSLVGLDGENISLSDFFGTPVMVNFWATWCPPCRREMPLIQEFAAAHQGALAVLAVNAGEDRTTIESFVESHELGDLIFLVDPENSVANLYRVPGFPTSLFIDAEGMLQAAHIGELDRDSFGQYLEKIGVE